MPSAPGSSLSSSQVSIEERVLILTPADARTLPITDVLRATEMPFAAFTNLEALVETLEEGAGRSSLTRTRSPSAQPGF